MAAARDGCTSASPVAVRVLVADDHPGIRVAVRSILEPDGFVICAEVADAEAAVREATRQRPDVCLLDVAMPGGGIAAAAAIADTVPTAAVVMLTVSEDDADLFGALRAGATGYLLKDLDPDLLATALRGVLRGEAALPPILVARVVQQFRDRSRRRVAFAGGHTAELTEREWEVVELLRRGWTTRAIAEELVVSPITVRRHVSELMRKLRVEDRAALLRALQVEVR